LDAETVLFDGPLQYREIPIYRLSAGRMIKTPMSYSVGFDIQPLQEMIDMVNSIAATNLSAFGVGSIIADKGAQVNYRQLSGGMKLLEINDGKRVEPFNMTHIPAEANNWLAVWEASAQLLSGVNNIARGNPESKTLSGAAMALLASQAILYNSDYQRSYSKLIAKVGTGIVNFLKDFSATKRMIAITGVANRSYMKEFTSEDISDISRVAVDLGSSLAKTTAGKLQIADQLLERGMLKTAEEYIAVLTTGNFDTLIEGEQKELLLIRSENEFLKDGKEIIVIASDNHPLHIREHKAVLADPESRLDDAVRKQALSHMQEHIEIMKTTDPNLLSILGMEPLQPQQQSPEQPMPQPTGEIAPIMSTEAFDESEMPSMPSMPENPMTGEEYVPPEGGELPQF